MNDNNLDGYEPLPRFEQTCCIKCKHFHGVDAGTCPAYPKGIPDKYAVRNLNAWMTVHAVIDEDQTGQFRFDLR